jgi:hypothetical protein
VVALAIGLVFTACIPPRPSPSPEPTPVETAVAIATPVPAATGSPGSTASGVAVDPSLLEVLPPTVEGVAITPDPATAGEIAAEGSIAPFVSAIALATAFGPPATDTTTDYVVITVAKLRPGTFSDLFFEGWRDTFDAAVCQQAGGVAGAAETDIGSRHTFIGTCHGGVHTYHVHLASRDLIVSMQGAGGGGWPEQIVRGLTE